MVKFPDCVSIIACRIDNLSRTPTSIFEGLSQDDQIRLWR